MNLKLISIAILLWALSACQERSTTPAPSFIHRVLDSLDIDRTKNVLIFTVNPNDCLSCINGFKDIYDDLAASGNARVFVIPVGRAIEKVALEKLITDIDLSPARNKAVIWSREVFYGVNHEEKDGIAMTQITIYNYNRDTILFSKPVREISDDRLLKAILSTQP